MAANKEILDKLLVDIEKVIPVEERWENLTLVNDFMFRVVMSEGEICKEMMHRILPNIEINSISIPEVQKTLQESPGTRGVRFDLYTRSDGGKIYDVEIQTTNNKDLPKRARAYQISMGLDVLNRDRNQKRLKHYNTIPDSYVIFICTFDLFKKNRAVYTFRNRCDEDSNLTMGDETVKVFTKILEVKNLIEKASAQRIKFINILKQAELLYIAIPIL